jgi:hypothetical protein
MTSPIRLAELDPTAVAREALSTILDHLADYVVPLMPSGEVRIIGTAEQLAAESTIGPEVSALTLYAQRGLPVWDWETTGEVSDALNGALAALYGSPMGRDSLGPIIAGGEAHDVVGDPDSAVDVVILGAWGRWRLDDGEPVHARDLAVLGGITHARMKSLGSAGEITITKGMVEAKEARRWLGARGVPGFVGRK